MATKDEEKEIPIQIDEKRRERGCNTCENCRPKGRRKKKISLRRGSSN